MVGRWDTLQLWERAKDPPGTVGYLTPSPGPQGLILCSQSVTGLNYLFERATSLAGQLSFLPLATKIVGQRGATTFTDTNAVGTHPFFYRVGVQN